VFSARNCYDSGALTNPLDSLIQVGNAQQQVIQHFFRSIHLKAPPVLVTPGMPAEALAKAGLPLLPQCIENAEDNANNQGADRTERRPFLGTPRSRFRMEGFLRLFRKQVSWA
jgi:hypothetical protein